MRYSITHYSRPYYRINHYVLLLLFIFSGCPVDPGGSSDVPFAASVTVVLLLVLLLWWQVSEASITYLDLRSPVINTVVSADLLRPSCSEERTKLNA